MQGLAAVIEEAMRFPGFAFVNVQSPCVTYGQEEQQLKAHKGTMQTLSSLGHDPADRLKAMALASEYGHKLYTGVFYRNPEPPPTYEAEARRRQEETRAAGPPEGAHPRDVPAAVARGAAMIDPHPIVLVAMGGHAFMQPGEAGTIDDHERNAAQIATLLMTLVERNYYICVTHGNGPQVGSLLLQQEIVARPRCPRCRSTCSWR